MKLPFMQWFPTDWISDTRHLSKAAKGVWVDLINFMWLAQDRGVYTRPVDSMRRELDIATLEWDGIIAELRTVADVTFSHTPEGELVTVMSRRMVREEKVRKDNRFRKQRSRGHAPVTSTSQDTSRNDHAGEVRSQMLDVRSQKENPPIVPLPGDSPKVIPKRARKERRAEDRINYWQDLVKHIDKAWMARKGAAYPWSDLEFKKLRDLAKTYQAGGVMAMWDLYMSMGTYFGKLTGFMIDGLKRDVGVIVDDPRWKPLSRQYEDKLPAIYEKGEGLVSIKEITQKIASGAKPLI
jgi:uncharacterized protein YdaU (DUF1376 family)